MKLLRLLSWPYMRKHVLRTLLTLAGIVLGAAVFTGMHTANQAVLNAFAQTIDRVAGKTDLQITAGETGFGEDILEKVQSLQSVAVAVPVIEAVAESDLSGLGSVLVIGVDMTGDRSLRDYDLESGDAAIVEDPLVFLAQPDSIILSKVLTDQYGLTIGGAIRLNTAEGVKAFTVRGVMQPTGLATAFGGNLAIMDVYAAQKMFGRGRTFDRIDVAIQEGTTLENVEQELRAQLGAGFEVQAPAQRGQQAEAVLAGYTLMVNISSAFALLVGMFIIYNAFATAAVQRRLEIGVLRALGATRPQIARLFLFESGILGLVGSIVGVGVGVVAARNLVSVMGALAQDLYGVTQAAQEIVVQPAVLAIAIGLGVATSLFAAALPARQAARIEPVHALKRGGYQPGAAAANRIRLGVAAVLGAVAAACVFFETPRPVFYSAYAAALMSALLLTPTLSVKLAKTLRPLLRWLRPVEGALAADSLIQAPTRTSASVAALMLSLALVVAFAGMAAATYRSVTEWMETTMTPDLFVMPSPRLDLRTRRFPATMAEEIAGLPGVERVQMYRNGRISLRGRPVMLVALEMSSVAETNRTRAVEGRVPDMYRAAAAGQGVIISDSLAQLHGYTLGDVIEIAAPYGMVRLPVIGTLTDYTDQQGSVFVDRGVFLRYWRDETVNDFRVFVASGASVTDVRQRIMDQYAGERQMFLLMNEESRNYILGVTGQWFSLMNVQVAIAVLVAFLGIVNSLTVSITDRRRELGVLQAVGALRPQIRRTIWIEAFAVATIGVILGVALGAVNLYYILDVVRRDVAGVRLDYLFPWATAAGLAPAMLVAGLVAAIWPAESAVRASLVEALEYE